MLTGIKFAEECYDVKLSKIQKLKIVVYGLWLDVKSKISPYWWMRYR